MIPARHIPPYHEDTYEPPPNKKIQTLNSSDQPHRAACYSWQVISHSSASEISSMVKENRFFSATSETVSVPAITLIRKDEKILLFCSSWPPCRSLTLHHASHLLLECEAATAHHAILVPALYMRFTVSSFPHFLSTVRGRLNSLSLSTTLS